MKTVLIISCAIFALTACGARVVNDSNYSETTPAAPAFGGKSVRSGFLPDINSSNAAALDGDTQIVTGSIQDDPNRINLSSYSQEQQKIDRERYAEQIANIASQRIEVTSAEVPQSTTISAAEFARSTTHSVGAKIYPRKGKRGSCGRYSSADAAQRAFLEAGGPWEDRLGLDSDGDGFACKFDPSIYRSLR